MTHSYAWRMSFGTTKLSPPKPLSQEELVRNWQTAKCRLSILCPTFNQVNFIDDALRGFLAQRTQFPFEIIIRDDASTDGTRQKLEVWAQQYPQIVRLICERKNTFSDIAAFDVLIGLAQGEFIATCEGDDYWTDPLKLQKQVDALQAHPEATAAFHRAVILDESTGHIGESLKNPGRSIKASDWLRDPSLPIQSLIFRNVVSAYPEDLPRIMNVDTYIQANLASQGDAVFLASVSPSVYRVHSSGIWSQTSRRDRAMTQANSFYWTGSSFADKGNPDAARVMLTLAAQVISESHIDKAIDPRSQVALRLSPLGRTIRLILGRAPRLRGLVRRVWFR